MSRRIISIISLGILLFIGLWNTTSEHWAPPKSGTINAVSDVDTILVNPEAYEGFTVYFVTWISTVETNQNDMTLTFVGVKEGVLSALVTNPLEGYKPGDSVAILGTSYIVSRGYILVDGIQKINHNVAIGFSLLGGVIFVYFFFSVNTFGSGFSFKRRA